MTQGDDYLGSIAMFAGPYAPVGYMDCDGRQLPVAQNQALFAVIGIDYGGNGTTTFALPDLRPRDKDGKPMPFERGKPRYCICVQGLWPQRP